MEVHSIAAQISEAVRNTFRSAMNDNTKKIVLLIFVYCNTRQRIHYDAPKRALKLHAGVTAEVGTDLPAG